MEKQTDKQLEDEIKRFNYLDNLGQHLLPVNENTKDNWYEWKRLRDKLPILQAELKGIQSERERIKKDIEELPLYSIKIKGYKGLFIKKEEVLKVIGEKEQ